jgi:hypothetical protein
MIIVNQTTETEDSKSTQIGDADDATQIRPVRLGGDSDRKPTRTATRIGDLEITQISVSDI